MASAMSAKITSVILLFMIRVYHACLHVTLLHVEADGPEQKLCGHAGKKNVYHYIPAEWPSFLMGQLEAYPVCQSTSPHRPLLERSSMSGVEMGG